MGYPTLTLRMCSYRFRANRGTQLLTPAPISVRGKEAPRSRPEDRRNGIDSERREPITRKPVPSSARYRKGIDRKSMLPPERLTPMRGLLPDGKSDAAVQAKRLSGTAGRERWRIWAWVRETAFQAEHLLGRGPQPPPIPALPAAK